MRSYAVIVAGVLAMAVNAQDSTVPSLPTPTGGDAAASSFAAQVNECLEECDINDLNCQARCISVPSPNEDQVNDTLECSRQCEQGDGSPAETDEFARCLAACRDEHFFSAGEGTPEPTNGGSEDSTPTGPASGEATPTGSASPDEPEASGSATEEESASGTDSATEAEESGESEGEDDDSAANLLVGSASLGLVGVLAAFFL